MLKLKLQYFGHLIRRTDSFEKTLMLGNIEGRRRRGWQRMRWWMASSTQWTWVWVSSRSWWWTGRPGVLQSMGLQRVGRDWETQLNWTESKMNTIIYKLLSCLVAKSCPTLQILHELQPSRILCPWDFPDKNTGVGCHFFLQEIFLNQGLHLPHLLHWQADSLSLCHLEPPLMIRENFAMQKNC